MVVAVAIWSKVVEAGEPIEFTPPADLRIANVALGADLADENGRTTLKLVYFGPAATEESDVEEEEEEEQDAEPIATVLCSLTPGKIEQAKIDLILEANQTYVLDTVGKNSVYISGNYIDQAPSDLPPDDDEVLSDEDDEAAFRLEDVSSDVEVDPDELMGDDEEAPELLQPPSPPKKQVVPVQPPVQGSKKRSREDAEEPQETQLSKKDRKKQKKMAEGGNAVPTGQTAEGKSTKEVKKSEKQKPANDSRSGEGQSQGEGKKKKKSKGDKAKL